jgi:hypothetical protein
VLIRRSSPTSRIPIAGIVAVALISLGAIGFGFAVAPQAQAGSDKAMLDKIVREGLDRSQVFATFGYFVDTVGPRLTASPAFLTAANWSRDQLARWGLRDARLEPWDFGRGWQLEQFTLEMVEPRYMPLIGYPEGWSASMPSEIVGTPIVVAGKTSEQLDAMKAQLKGAILLTQPAQDSFIREDRPQPTAPGYVAPAPAQPAAQGRGRGGAATAQGGGRGSQQQFFRDAGAGVLLRTSRGEHGTMFVLGRDQGAAAMPSVIVAGEHYNMIARMLAAGMPVKLRVNLKSRYLDADHNGYNVLAELPGSDPALKDQVVMIGGHLDSWHSAPGATDNADGAAVVLEAMRILTSIGATPRRTIRVALWGGEEEGLLGSKEYVSRHLAGEGNAAARANFSAYFNIDPGTGPIYGWYLQGQENVRTIMDEWLAPFLPLGARKNVPDSIGNTDHLSFTALGLPAFNPVQDYVNYDVRTHHTNVDTYERVREADLRQAAVIMAGFAYQAAMTNDLVPRP